ncbi:hypothetical protein ABZ816_11510 [Actinosynnema sp. NPDC047251]|uniref:Uncharacterized protein n=1 Tax=Saccharothrix espanaensis (strain ATCC 51144 / DSM 44229 / JCM 9112 / NBRC 15066 / NRRL 15764) TaxID=1179773 RepID=K0KFD0_SACES|nr:hypothetical protein [Saccharothrix espanaensis]CCH35223.1 hypothetical protein BN6_80050 [Saccharothrix espanaensis DSM 44229]
MGRSAEQRYGNLVNSMDFVTDQLGPVGKLVDKMRDNPAPPGSWRVTPPDELKKMLAGVLEKLSALKDSAVRYETELKTREWKV